MGKHGDHPVCQVYTCPPLECLPVKGASLLYIVGYVCNMNSQLIIIPFSCQRNGVVQIFGILPVYGDHLPVPQIHPAFAVGRTYVFSHTYSLVEHFIRKFRLDPKIHHNRENVRPGIIDMTYDLYYFSFRLCMLPAVRSQFCHYLMAAHGAHFLSRRYIDIFEISLIVRPYKAKVFALFVQAYDLCHCMGDNADDFAFFSLPAPGFYDNILDFISLKRSVYIFFRNKNIFPSISRSHKSKASGVCLKDSCKTLRRSAAVFSSL